MSYLLIMCNNQPELTMKTSQLDLNRKSTIGERTLKYTIIIAFFFLPKRVTETFVFLCIMSILKLCRPSLNANYIIDTDMFQQLLDINYIDEITIVPEKSIRCFWGHDFMNQWLCLDDKHYQMKDLVSDVELSKRYKEVIIEEVLKFLPRSMYRKLHVGNRRVRDNLTRDFSVMFVL